MFDIVVLKLGLFFAFGFLAAHLAVRFADAAGSEGDE